MESGFLDLENSRIQKALRTFLFHQILLGSKLRKIGNWDLNLKEIRIKREVLDGVKISKGRIVGRVDGHVIYDPSA